MKTAIIIPAYNEAPTISQVVQAAVQAKVGEVWVVSDGSSDATAQLARDAGAKVLELNPNRGKGGAIQAGLEATQSDVIVVLDADLIGLDPAHLHLLLEPIRSGEADATIGVFSGGRWFTDWASWLTREWSGQRAFRRSLVEGLQTQSLRYAVELALTQRFQSGRLKYVNLPKLTHRTKEEKLGFWSGFTARLKMFEQLFRFRLSNRT